MSSDTTSRDDTSMIRVFEGQGGLQNIFEKILARFFKFVKNYKPRYATCSMNFMQEVQLILLFKIRDKQAILKLEKKTLHTVEQK